MNQKAGSSNPTRRTNQIRDLYFGQPRETASLVYSPEAAQISIELAWLPAI
jgi:hypothetical protein